MTKSKRRKISLAFTGLLVVCIMLSVFTKIKADNQEDKFEKVSVVTYSGKQLSNGMDLSAIEYVTYNGKIYKLRNSDTLKGTQAGQTITAYLYKDKMYVDKAGAVTSTPLYITYYVFMFLSVALLIVTLMLWFGKSKKQVQDKKDDI